MKKLLISKAAATALMINPNGVPSVRPEPTTTLYINL
jgi:hypothetical protein